MHVSPKAQLSGNRRTFAHALAYALILAVAAATSGATPPPPITKAGDPIRGGQLNGSVFTVGSAAIVDGANNWPPSENPDNAIDEAEDPTTSRADTKYNNYAETNTGYVVTPAAGSSIVQAIDLTTANDHPERDPLTFSLYGSDTVVVTGSEVPGATFSVTDFTLIADNQATGLAIDPGRKQTVLTTVSNAATFKTYLLVFHTVRDGTSAQSMQIGDAILLGTIPPKIVTVSNGHDHGPGSLRAAIANAASGDTIEFAPNVTTVTLTTGPLSITDKDLTIKGPGAKELTVRRSAKVGTPPFPVFETLDHKATLSGMTITNGRALNGGGGGISISYSTAAILGCAITGNKGTQGGGVGSFSSDVTIKGSTVSDNSTAEGGAGGGLYSDSEMLITRSTIARNSAPNGGGIMNYGRITLINSTVASNSASESAGGIYNQPGTVESPNVVSAKNTIIAKNSDGNGHPDYFGRLRSMGYNLIGNTNGITAIGGDTTGNQKNVDPRLRPLDDNGGPTLTKALLLDSPAIDKGNSGAATIDQRRLSRPFDNPAHANAKGGDGSDIGAVEMQENEFDAIEQPARADTAE